MKKIYFSFLILLAGLMALKAQNNTLRSDPEKKGNTEQSLSPISNAQNNFSETYQPPAGVPVVNSQCGLNIYPVPSAGNCVLTVSSPVNEKIKLQLIDAAGRTVWQNTEMVNTGENTFNYSFTTLAQGNYIMQVHGNNINDSRRIVIVK